MKNWTDVIYAHIIAADTPRHMLPPLPRGSGRLDSWEITPLYLRADGRFCAAADALYAERGEVTGPVWGLRIAHRPSWGTHIPGVGYTGSEEPAQQPGYTGPRTWHDVHH